MAAVLGLALLMGAPLWLRNNAHDVVTPLTDVHPFSLFSRARHEQNLPGTLRDIDQYNSSTMTVYNDVRAPFGPNPNERYVNAWDFIDNPLWARRYQREIKNLRADEPDWRLDVFTQSSMNTFGNYHSAEAPYAQLLNFHRPQQQPITPGPHFRTHEQSVGDARY